MTQAAKSYTQDVTADDVVTEEGVGTYIPIIHDLHRLYPIVGIWVTVANDSHVGWYDIPQNGAIGGMQVIDEDTIHLHVEGAGPAAGDVWHVRVVA